MELLARSSAANCRNARGAEVPGYPEIQARSALGLRRVFLRTLATFRRKIRRIGSLA